MNAPWRWYRSGLARASADALGFALVEMIEDVA
jgi:hypothetical protein